jgi:2-dehydro-3-deoxygluconokinase
MASVATFGEILLRLSPPGKDRLFQRPALHAFFGGAEANVAVALTGFGHQARFISVVPANDIGEAALRELRRYGVDASFVARYGRRLGVYFAESGAGQRASQVIYDRAFSGLAEAGPGIIAWDKALAGVSWLHVTGITPAVSRTAAELTLDAVKTAKQKGLRISVDLNYRSKLWNYGVSAPEVMPGLFIYADVGLANEEDIQKALGIGNAATSSDGSPNLAAYESLTREVMDRFPNLDYLAVTLRDSLSADHTAWSGVLRSRTEFLPGPRYDIERVVDRIGTGDAFAAGIIHGLTTGLGDREALSFAVAASCLKHSIPGDFNLVSAAEVTALMAGDRSGRIRR